MLVIGFSFTTVNSGDSCAAIAPVAITRPRANEKIFFIIN
jgi:hypothetical protein